MTPLRASDNVDRHGENQASPWRSVTDVMVGPGATRGEAALALGAGVAAALVLPLLARTDGAAWALGEAVVAAVLAFDLAGGVVVNASGPGRRHHHRSGRTERHHLGFVALHTVHVGVVAWLFAAEPIAWGAAVSVGLLLATAAVRATPLHLRRGVAMLFLTAAIAAAPAVAPDVGTGWFVPVLALKLLVCYLLGDVPAAPTASPRRSP